MNGPDVDTRPLARLLEGLQALDEGRLGVARFRFDQILAEARRAPSLEAGHAWRALAEISVRRGDVANAEVQLKSAVSAYREVARVDPTARARAGEGEGAALLLAAELLLRRGLTEAGRQVLVRAAEVLARLGDDRSAEAWATTGRLATHLGLPNRAREAFREALGRYERVDNVAGHAEVLLEAAALELQLGDAAAASRMFDLAAAMSRNAGRLATTARAHLGRARIAADEPAALEAWEQALHAGTVAGDVVIVGFALLGLGACGWRGGDQPLLAGAQLLLDGGHYPGLGLGLLRVAEWCLTHDEPEAALVACEGAWRVYRGFDRVHGLGRVLRVVVKAFAALREPRPTLLAAYARAALIGRHDPHAVEVRDHYAALSPRSLTVRLGMVPPDVLLDDTRRALQRRIVPALREQGLMAQSFATAQGALDVLGVMLGTSPRGAVRALVPEPSVSVPASMPEAELPDLDDLQFGRRTTLRFNLPGTGGAGALLTERHRSPVYDPGGRLAAVASKSLVFVDDVPATGAARDSVGLEVAEAPEAPAFPDDAGVSEWMRLDKEGIAWKEGEDLFGTGPVASGSAQVALYFEEQEDEDTDEAPAPRRELLERAFPRARPRATPSVRVDDPDAECTAPAIELPTGEAPRDADDDMDDGS